MDRFRVADGFAGLINKIFLLHLQAAPGMAKTLPEYNSDSSDVHRSTGVYSKRRFMLFVPSQIQFWRKDESC